MQLQYIGARYVPVWYRNSVDDTSNWEVNVEYEPLTFVTSQNNHLYISKKTVPDNIGTPADNTEYWLDMGVFSGSYSDLLEMIGDLGDLDTTDKSNLVAAINEVFSGSTTAENVTYDNTDSGLEATNVQEAIDEIVQSANAPRRVIVVSDSYGVPADDTNFVTKLQTLLGLSGDDFYNISGNSIGFCNPGGIGNRTALQELSAHESDITDHSTISDIIVTVGINDATHSDYSGTIVSAVEAFISYCKSTYPNATIWYGFAGNCTGGSYSYTVINRYYSLIPTIYNTFAVKECKLLAGIEYILHDARNINHGDWLHPINTGATKLAEFIFEYLTTGTAVYRTFQHFTNNDGAELLITIEGALTNIEIVDLGNQGSGTINGMKDLVNLSGSAVQGVDAINEYFPMFFIVSGQYMALPIKFGATRIKAASISSVNYTGASKACISVNTLYV